MNNRICLIAQMRAVAFRLCVLGLGPLLFSGCASYGVIDNSPITEISDDHGYTIKNIASTRLNASDISLTLAFSGGGTRAAAVSYGVLEELRDTTIKIDGRSRRLLDEIDVITSVSGGSFTSAYYGLNGDGIFEDFEEAFLRRNYQSRLLWGLFNPINWFSNRGRTERAIRFFDNSIFHGATFTDLQRKGGPLIVINASDLRSGLRFSFLQEYFNLLCSDISTFPVVRAVAASSAVPVLFNPVVVKNHPDCGVEDFKWLQDAEDKAVNDPQISRVVDGLQGYFDKQNRRYIHLVDGGITDNLGLRAVYEVIEVAGGVKNLLNVIELKPAQRFVVISVNASTKPDLQMDLSPKQPSLEETINSVTDVQLHLYNAATIDLMQKSIKRWSSELSTPEQPIEPYFIQINFSDIKHSDRLRFINNIPTSFSLRDEEVDELIKAGHELLRNNPEFQRFISDMKTAP